MVGKFSCGIAQYRTVENERIVCFLFGLAHIDFLIMITVAVFNLGQAILADVAQVHIEVPEQSG
jgi:hypothetical protein